jgi:hypothetical protein
VSLGCGWADAKTATADNCSLSRLANTISDTEPPIKECLQDLNIDTSSISGGEALNSGIAGTPTHMYSCMKGALFVRMNPKMEKSYLRCIQTMYAYSYSKSCDWVTFIGLVNLIVAAGLRWQYKFGFVHLSRYAMDTTERTDLHKMRDATQSYLDTPQLISLMKQVRLRMMSVSRDNSTCIMRSPVLNQ